MNGEDSLLDYLNLAGDTAGTVLGALNKPKTTAKAAPTNWGLIAGIGAGVLILFVVVISLVGRK